MRRSVQTCFIACRMHYGCKHMACAALAIGAGHMDHRWHVLFGMAQLGEQPLNALQAEVNQLGMEREQALQNSVGTGHGDEILEQQHGALLAPGVAADEPSRCPPVAGAAPRPIRRARLRAGR